VKGISSTRSLVIFYVHFRIINSPPLHISPFPFQSWTFDQMLLPFQVFGSGICCPVSVGRPLWREAWKQIRMIDGRGERLRLKGNAYNISVIKLERRRQIGRNWNGWMSRHELYLSGSVHELAMGFYEQNVGHSESIKCDNSHYWINDNQL
jgi:hypothetical protein